MVIRDHIPKGAEIHLDGQWYKVGSHNVVFVYSVDGWRRSRKDPDEVKLAIATEKRKAEIYNRSVS